MGKAKKKDKKRKKEKKKAKLSGTDDVDTAYEPLQSSLLVAVTSGPSISSWSAAFSNASTVKPIELGNYKEPIGNDDALGVCSLARECLKRKAVTDESTITPKDISTPEVSSERKKSKKKKSERDSKEATPTDVLTNEAPPSLEGRMIEYQGESILSLVDVERKVVYSGLERTEAGDMIVIGSIEENGTISFIKEDKTPDFPYQTQADDHCESPADSYHDIKPILQALAKGKGGMHKLAIYDPYYCNGSVIRHLSEIGFSNVYNKREDCYKTWSPDDVSQPYPSFDVFLTNPPYSGDHIPRLFDHICSQDFVNSRKPWLLLMPTYVHKKDYYKEALKKSGVKPFYLVPKKRYVYLPPKNFREKKISDVHKKSSPFTSMWYVWGGSRAQNESMIQSYQRGNKDALCEIARSKSALRDLRRKKD